MTEIPEILLRCCNILHKPSSIRVFDEYILFLYRCSICHNHVYIEIKIGMKSMLINMESSIELKKSTF